MSSVTVRNLPDATQRALKLRAAQHGRSQRSRNSLDPGSCRGPSGGLGIGFGGDWPQSGRRDAGRWPGVNLISAGLESPADLNRGALPWQ